MPYFAMDAKEFSKLNGKCVSGKALITKTCSKFEQLCEEMDQMEDDIPELSRVRKATFLTEQVDKVRKATDNLEANAQTLMEAVWELQAGSRTKDARGSEMTAEEMYNNISTKIQEYVDKAEGPKLRRRHRTELKETLSFGRAANASTPSKI